MFEAFSKAQWKTTLIFFVVCGALAAAAGVVGMDDNPVGGSLAWLSAIALVLAVAHPWRTSRRFLLLTGASVLAFIACTLAQCDVGERRHRGRRRLLPHRHLRLPRRTCGGHHRGCSHLGHIETSAPRATGEAGQLTLASIPH